MRLQVALLLAAVLALGAGAAHANPSEDLVRARRAFREGNYSETVSLLSPNLYPAVSLSDTAEIVEAYVLLGVSYLELGNRRGARAAFEGALLLDSTLALDEGLYEERVVAFFNDVRTDIRAQIEEAERKRREAEEAERRRRALATSREIVIEKRAYYVNFIPFGAGQFQNGQRGKGVFFAVSQALLGGTSVTLFTAQVLKYGYGGSVPREDIDSVNRIQLGQVVTGGLFIAVAAWGVIDALATYQPTKTITRDFTDPALRGEPPPAASWHIVPVAGPGGTGLVLSWEF